MCDLDSDCEGTLVCLRSNGFENIENSSSSGKAEFTTNGKVCGCSTDLMFDNIANGCLDFSKGTRLYISVLSIYMILTFICLSWSLFYFIDLYKSNVLAISGRTRGNSLHITLLMIIIALIFAFFTDLFKIINISRPDRLSPPDITGHKPGFMSIPIRIVNAISIVMTVVAVLNISLVWLALAENVIKMKVTKRQATSYLKLYWRTIVFADFILFVALLVIFALGRYELGIFICAPFILVLMLICFMVSMKLSVLIGNLMGRAKYAALLMDRTSKLLLVAGSCAFIAGIAVFAVDAAGKRNVLLPPANFSLYILVLEMTAGCIRAVNAIVVVFIYKTRSSTIKAEQNQELVNRGHAIGSVGTNIP